MREIIWSAEFTEGVEALGGAAIVDRALEPVLEALSRNPYGFQLLENDWVSFRVIRTKAIGYDVPALIISFTIDENRNVVLQLVEEDLPF